MSFHQNNEHTLSKIDTLGPILNQNLKDTENQEDPKKQLKLEEEVLNDFFQKLETFEISSKKDNIPENIKKKSIITNGMKLEEIKKNSILIQQLQEKIEKNGIKEPYLMLNITSNNDQEYDLEIKDIQEVFASFGDVQKVLVQPEGKAYIVYKNLGEAAIAQTFLDGHVIQDQEIDIKLQVDWCSPEELQQESLYLNPSNYDNGLQLPYELVQMNNKFDAQNFNDVQSFNTNNFDNEINDNNTISTPVSTPSTNFIISSNPLKYTCRFEIQIDNDHKFQVARKIIGAKGHNMKTIIKSCIEKQQGTKKNKENLKLRLRGKGSGYQEGPQKRESDEPLHLCVSSKYEDIYNDACALVIELLTQVYEQYYQYCQDNQIEIKILQIKQCDNNNNPTKNVSPNQYQQSQSPLINFQQNQKNQQQLQQQQQNSIKQNGLIQQQQQLAQNFKQGGSFIPQQQQQQQQQQQSRVIQQQQQSIFQMQQNTNLNTFKFSPQQQQFNNQSPLQNSDAISQQNSSSHLFYQQHQPKQQQQQYLQKQQLIQTSQSQQQFSSQIQTQQQQQQQQQSHKFSQQNFNAQHDSSSVDGDGYQNNVNFYGNNGGGYFMNGFTMNNFNSNSNSNQYQQQQQMFISNGNGLNKNSNISQQSSLQQQNGLKLSNSNNNNNKYFNQSSSLQQSQSQSPQQVQQQQQQQLSSQLQQQYSQYTQEWNNSNASLNNINNNNNNQKFSEQVIQFYVEERNNARKENNYKKADEIREFLRQHGIILQDEKGGRGKGNEVTTWRHIQHNNNSNNNSNTLNGTSTNGSVGNNSQNGNNNSSSSNDIFSSLKNSINGNNGCSNMCNNTSNQFNQSSIINKGLNNNNNNTYNQFTGFI